MMLSIKPLYHNTAIAFQGSGVVLKKRTQAELIDLALLAHSSGDASIIRFFEYLPPVADLQRMKMKLKEIK